LLIALCGIDGAGKTTQQRLLGDWLAQQGQAALLTAQPTPLYRQDPRVRTYLNHGEACDMRTLALLSAADRRWHVASQVQPALAEGRHVVTDRYLYSALAYFAVRGLDVDYVRRLNQPLIEPDVTVFLDVPPEAAVQRVAARDGELAKYEERRAGTLAAVRAAFSAVLPSQTLILDATDPPAAIHQRIVERVQQCRTRLAQPRGG
jgi:dTMP kinase